MAKTVRVKWIEKRQFVGVDESKHAVAMSSQDAENGTGISPSQLLLVALGGCTAYDVMDILYKKRQPLAGLEVTVTSEQDAEPPWAYRKIHIHYMLRGKELKEKAVADAISPFRGEILFRRRHAARLGRDHHRVHHRRRVNPRMNANSR